jgi:K+-sensing histidine kinase KdpD
VRGEDDGKYLLAGMGGAALLGIVLIPLRELTPASNLSFPFLLLTIVIAEMGGSMAVIGTALVSALSLDFFLTQPYYSLTMDDTHDAVAFLGLAVCGLVVAAASNRRARKIAHLAGTSGELHVLREVVRTLGAGSSRDVALGETLHLLMRSLPVSAVVVRNLQEEMLAGSGEGIARRLPTQLLRADTLQVEGMEEPLVLGADVPLPGEGGRIPLRFHDRQVGWLDVWGNGETATPGMRHTLFDVAWLLSAALSR